MDESSNNNNVDENSEAVVGNSKQRLNPFYIELN